jgi:hypothetical protein
MKSIKTDRLVDFGLVVAAVVLLGDMHGLRHDVGEVDVQLILGDRRRLRLFTSRRPLETPDQLHQRIRPAKNSIHMVKSVHWDLVGCRPSFDGKKILDHDSKGTVTWTLCKFLLREKFALVLG